MRTYAGQIADYLRSDPSIAADGSDISLLTPLLGTLTGGAPGPGEQDARSYSGLAAGGIYTRAPKPWDPKDNRGATPIAFSATSGVIKPCLAVIQESTIPHAQAERILKAQNVSISVWMYAPSHETGKEIAEAMRVRIDALVDNYLFTTDQGFGASIRFAYSLGLVDNHREFSGSLVDFVRYFITTLRGPEV